MGREGESLGLRIGSANNGWSLFIFFPSDRLVSYVARFILTVAHHKTVALFERDAVARPFPAVCNVSR